MLNAKKNSSPSPSNPKIEADQNKWWCGGGLVVVVLWWLDLGFVSFGFDGFLIVVLWWWWLGLFGFEVGFVVLMGFSCEFCWLWVCWVWVCLVLMGFLCGFCWLWVCWDFDGSYYGKCWWWWCYGGWVWVCSIFFFYGVFDVSFVIVIGFLTWVMLGFLIVILSYSALC